MKIFLIFLLVFIFVGCLLCLFLDTDDNNKYTFKNFFLSSLIIISGFFTINSIKQINKEENEILENKEQQIKSLKIIKTNGDTITVF